MNQRLAATRQTDHQRPVSQPMNAPLPAGSLVHPLLRLQHTTGNQAVQRLVKVALAAAPKRGRTK